MSEMIFMASSSTPSTQSASPSHTVKVSLVVKTAKDTAKHNDRSMYSAQNEAYARRDTNLHWDCYNLNSSVAAEARWYDEYMLPRLVAHNDRMLVTRQYTRVQDMKTFHAKHMPQEAIIQLGANHDFNDGLIDDSFCREVIPLVMDYLTSCGMYPISWDLHNDETYAPSPSPSTSETTDAPSSAAPVTHVEQLLRDSGGTPHLHIRFVPLSQSGDINMSACLREHNVEPPYPDNESYRAYLLASTSDPGRASHIRAMSDSALRRANNAKITFTSNLRTLLEDYADSWCTSRNLTLDRTNRTHRPNKKPAAYRAMKFAEDADRYEAIAADAKSKSDAAMKTLSDLTNQISDMQSDTFTVDGKTYSGLATIKRRYAEALSKKKGAAAELARLREELIATSDKLRQSQEAASKLAAEAAAFQSLIDAEQSKLDDDRRDFLNTQSSFIAHQSDLMDLIISTMAATINNQVAAATRSDTLRSTVAAATTSASDIARRLISTNSSDLTRLLDSFDSSWKKAADEASALSAQMSATQSEYSSTIKPDTPDTPNTSSPFVDSSDIGIPS